MPVEQVVDVDRVAHGRATRLRAASDPPKGQPEPYVTTTARLLGGPRLASLMSRPGKSDAS
jgi:hypothetical protein